MTESVERVMQELYDRLSGTDGFTKVVRSEYEILDDDALPLLVLSQGGESLELVTLGGVEANLSVSVHIACLKGTQNIETTLNKLRRNVLRQIYDQDFVNIDSIHETSASKPEIVQREGSPVGSITIDFEVIYIRQYNDPE